MLRRFSCLAAAAAFCLMTACTPTQVKPYSDSAFYGNCIMPFGPDPCDADLEICQTFQDVFKTDYADVEACRAACNKIFIDQNNKYLGRNCFYMLDHGGNLCEQQCNRLYPKQK